MKKVLLIISLITSATILHAQTELIVKRAGRNLYLDHKVAAKENFYSIGRKYNVNAKAIASFNALDMKKGLVIGKLIKIPLSDSNFVQDKVEGTPVYYVVGDKETLTRVSAGHNKVSIDNLRSWNHLPNDNISKGQKLIVGFLSVSGSHSAEVVEVRKEESTKASDIIKEEAKNEASQIIEKKMDEVKQETEQPKREEIVTKKEEQKTEDLSQGYFKVSFDGQVKQTPQTKSQTVTSGIFKTTSGWNDKKYYLLIDGVQAGTIVKITNPANNKVVYAKVLGEMNGLAQNDGIDIRISNSAASTLEVTETEKFILKLNY